jgi:hypothetical protein
MVQANQQLRVQNDHLTNLFDAATKLVTLHHNNAGIDRSMEKGWPPCVTLRESSSGERPLDLRQVHGNGACVQNQAAMLANAIRPFAVSNGTIQETDSNGMKQVLYENVFLPLEATTANVASVKK